MEYIQAFLFTSKYILGRGGNADIFYLFSAVVLLFYVFKRHSKLLLIAKISLPFIIVTSIMAFLYPWSDMFRSFIFLVKMILNVTLVVFVSFNSRKWDIYRFAEAVVWIQAAETVVAILFPESSLWYQDQFVTGSLYASRLRLFYQDAGSMAFTSGIILIMLIYQMMTQEVFWRQAIGAIVMMVDMYLSYALGAISCVIISVILMVVLGLLYKRRNGDHKSIKRIILTFVFSFSIIVAVVLTNKTFTSRIAAILRGEDAMVNNKLLIPIAQLGNVLDKTHFLGVGFGSGNIPFALDLIGSGKAFPNSFLRIIAEGGVFGIILIIVIVAGLGVLCLKYGKNLDKALYAYVMLYQVTGGYFTDATNFFIYGWIIGDCLYNMVEKTGDCPIRIFIPIHKEKLKIAMVGHKHIPGREGGVEVVVEELSKRFVQMGHQVDAYNRSGQHIAGAENSQVDYKSLKSYEGIGIINVPTINRKGFAALIYSFIASIIVAFKDYDVVHYHAEGPCAFMWIPSMFGIRTVCTIHGLDWARTGKWGSLASSFIKFGERVAVGVADSMIVLSKHLQQYFKDSYNRETHLIYNGVSKPVLREAGIIKEKWGIGKDEYILSLSRLTREKKIDLLIEAFKKTETDKKLVVAGGSSDSGDYVNYLKELAGDDDRIIFTGFVKGRELEELYSNAYLYCLPSELEGMPLSLLEAMSYGNCCLTSDIPENADVVQDKGVVFRSNDLNDLVNALQKLIDNADMQAHYRSMASEYICSKYNWDDIAGMTMELYGNSDIT